MHLSTKIERAVYLARRKLSLVVISLMYTVGNIIPAYAGTSSNSSKSDGAAGGTDILNTNGDVEMVKGICQFWTKWGWILIVATGFAYFKSKGDEKNNGITKASLGGAIFLWIASLNDGTVLFMIINFIKYLGGLIQ